MDTLGTLWKGNGEVFLSSSLVLIARSIFALLCLRHRSLEH